MDDRSIKMPKISDKLFFEILSWLPVSSLLRFRLVCKSWFSLITQNPKFAKSQLLRANATQIDSPMIMFNSHVDGTLCSISYADIASPPPLSSVTNVSENLMKHPVTSHFIQTVASCNGLVCISMCFNENQFFRCIWNPYTKEFKRIPDIPYKRPPRSYLLIASGFGCNRTLDDYKLIRISHGFSDEEHYNSVECYDIKEENFYLDVYTLSSNSWKRIRNMTCKIRNFGATRGLHTNGSLHWIGSLSTTESDDGIISFDIEDEVYREVPKPQYLDNMDCVRLRLLGGCLCLFKFVSKDCLDVWMMKEYGVKESWTKLFTTTQDLLHYDPLWLFKHGEVLMEFDRKCLFLYDPKCDVLKYIGPRPFDYGSDTVPYIESLVSLQSRTYACQCIVSSEEKKSKKKKRKPVSLQSGTYACQYITSSEEKKSKKKMRKREQGEEEEEEYEEYREDLPVFEKMYDLMSDYLEEQRNIRLATAANLPVPIEGEESSMAQVLELICNAREFLLVDDRTLEFAIGAMSDKAEFRTQFLSLQNSDAKTWFLKGMARRMGV